jgi:CheY-like chemotaxis protein
MRDSAEFAGAGSNVQVRIYTDPGLKLAIADPVKLSQVLQNLVFNGIQAMPCGGYMDVEARNIIVPAAGDGKLRAGDHVKITVRDRGCGIAHGNLAVCFVNPSPPRRTATASASPPANDSSTRWAVTSASIPRRTSAPSFSVILRRWKAPQPTLLLTSQPTTRRPAQARRGTVLIVDDEDDLRRVAQMILKRCGYEVVQCDNGQDAVRIYQSLFRTGTPPDVVLMDLTLRGGMNGTETAAEILALDRDARIVCTSGSVTTGSADGIPGARLRRRAAKALRGRRTHANRPSRRHHDETELSVRGVVLVSIVSASHENTPPLPLRPRHRRRRHVHRDTASRA